MRMWVLYLIPVWFVLCAAHFDDLVNEQSAQQNMGTANCDVPGSKSQGERRAGCPPRRRNARLGESGSENSALFPVAQTAEPQPGVSGASSASGLNRRVSQWRYM